MAPGILMEVCVDSVESAISAERGGASRIELCSSLVEGGVTPSIGLLQVVKQYVKIPVFAIVRPRGGDFLYTDSEIEVMKADIKMAKASGANGIVFGVLTEDGRVNCEVCLDLIAESRPLPVTFHRAFDMVHDPSTALECLISLGFDRVLTSGCDSTALEGLPTLKHLVEQVSPRWRNNREKPAADSGRLWYLRISLFCSIFPRLFNEVSKQLGLNGSLPLPARVQRESGRHL
ncbi:copper homeostasis protein cutC homolog isoform X3 [Hemitrygon akajei]|uniref:copper homeostasis protein cutC homolog isoform X3 n=1 Tax=Hemitrygon akajei TaxID=2704970 RepID=UPI003BFA1619